MSDRIYFNYFSIVEHVDCFQHLIVLNNSFLIYFTDYAIIVVPFFSPLYPSPSCTPFPPVFPPPWIMSMGRTYKFFGFSISYTILNLPLYLLCLPIMLLIPCTFPPFFLLPLPLIKLHVISISVILCLF